MDEQEQTIEAEAEQTEVPGERAVIARWVDELLGCPDAEPVEGEEPDEDTSVVLADGFEAAFLGVGQQFNGPPIAVYDSEECLRILMSRDGMSYEEAVEFFEFNVAGAYVGAQTPMFIVPFQREVTE